MKNKSFLLIILMSLFIVACEDIFEKDLTKTTFHLFAPSNDIVSSDYDQIFEWDVVEGARNYEIIIVKPDFNKIQKLLVDSILTSNLFAFTIPPGSYQWKVMARNGSSYATSEIFSFTIDSAISLSSKTVSLIGPKDFLNKSSSLFQWKSVPIASKYIFEIRSPDWETGSVVFNQETTAAEITYSGLENKRYAWGVKAINTTSESIFSYFSFVADTIVPSAPLLSSPLTDSVITDTVIVFSWHRKTDSGSGVSYDSLYVLSDATTPSVLHASFRVSDSSYTATISKKGKYSWKVKSIDNAGNVGVFCTPFKFTID